MPNQKEVLSKVAAPCSTRSTARTELVALCTLESDVQQISLPNSPSEKTILPLNLKKPWSETNWRWLALLFINLFVLGNYISNDAPQPLETQFKEIMGLSDSQYSLLYTIRAAPSVLIPFFGGFFIDRVGVRPTLIIVSVLVTLER